MTDLEVAWNEIHDVKPDGWFVGQPTHGRHSRASSQRRGAAKVREMARCLRLIGEGRVPN